MRLIDADALIAEIVGTTTFIKDSVLFQKMVNEAPTIEPSGDLISRADAIYAIEESITWEKSDYDFNKGMEMALSIIRVVPSAEMKEYVKDGTLTVQARTIKEATLIDKVVVYADGYEQEYLMPIPSADVVPQEEVVEIKKNYIDEISGLLNRIDELTLQTPQTYGKSINLSNAEVVADYISRADAIEAIEDTDWFHINKNGEMVQGSTTENESWYKHDDIFKALESVPSADRPTEEGNFNKCHGCKHERIRWRMLSGSHDSEPCIWCSRTLLDRYERNEE